MATALAGNVNKSRRYTKIRNIYPTFPVRPEKFSKDPSKVVYKLFSGYQSSPRKFRVDLVPKKVDHYDVCEINIYI